VYSVSPHVISAVRRFRGKFDVIENEMKNLNLLGILLCALLMSNCVLAQKQSPKVHKQEKKSEKNQTMEAKEAIEAALPVFEKHKNSEDDVVEQALKSAGIPSQTAVRLVEFMPLAFGRVFMDGMGITFEENYIRLNRKTKQEKRGKLADEKFYTESLSFARQIVGQQTYSKAFQAVALRSAEVNAVNNALNNGSKPENLVLSSPVFLWEEENQNDVSESKQSKSWWRFWT
jgi:hypothetical protein